MKNFVSACYQVEEQIMSSVAAENRKRLEEFDQKVLALYTENPKLINAELAKSFECRYDEIVRSLRRSGIVRKTGRPRKGN